MKILLQLKPLLTTTRIKMTGARRSGNHSSDMNMGVDGVSNMRFIVSDGRYLS
jgi:hypothetical protein